jgi:hypothetical protein
VHAEPNARRALRKVAHTNARKLASSSNPRVIPSQFYKQERRHKHCHFRVDDGHLLRECYDENVKRNRGTDGD